MPNSVSVNFGFWGEILGACGISFRCIRGPGEGCGSYELGETKVSLRDTQFLRIGKVLQEVH